MDYTLLTCYNTMLLYRRHRVDYDLYIPIERFRRVDKRTGITTVAEYPCMPGLMFCPAGLENDLQSRLPEELYNLQVPMTVNDFRPYRVPLDQLQDMQRALNKEFASGGLPAVDHGESTDEPEEWYELGESVRLLLPFFQDVDAKVVRFKDGGSVVRLEINGGKQHLELRRAYIAKV